MEILIPWIIAIMPGIRPLRPSPISNDKRYFDLKCAINGWYRTDVVQSTIAKQPVNISNAMLCLAPAIVIVLSQNIAKNMHVTEPSANIKWIAGVSTACQNFKT